MQNNTPRTSKTFISRSGLGNKTLISRPFRTIRIKVRRRPSIVSLLIYPPAPRTNLHPRRLYTLHRRYTPRYFKFQKYS